MHIILVSDRMATARSITLTRRHLVLAVTGLAVLVLALSSMFSYLTVRHAAELRLPFLRELVRSLSFEEAIKTQELVRENLTNMASRLGELQGKLMQLDTLGERLAGLAGVGKPKEAKTTPPVQSVAGTGGPLVRPDNLTTLDMQRALDELSRQVEVRSETLVSLESRLLDERVRQSLLPTSSPIEGDARAMRSSGFGWRIDPFNGQSALHEGIDFVAEPGTPIIAAAAGIVIAAERHSQYGNVVEIDHGNEMMTRYAHAQEIFVKPGELVRRGQKIAAVGSTGRSTGPHLHFEVRIRGVAQNPARFLDQPTQPRLARR